MCDKNMYTTRARASYDIIRRDIEDAAVNSEELGEMIREMMIRTYGVERCSQWFRAERVDEGMEASYNQFRSLILLRVYGELKQAYADAFAMEVQA